MSMRVSNWVVKKLLGEGAFGRTYYGEHWVLGADLPVCIKEEKTGQAPYMELFRKEALLLAKLRHFGLPTLLDYVENSKDGQLMVLSFIPGVPLDKDIEQNGPVTDEHLFWVLDRILAPLGYMHGKWSMVHCDLKPANIILDIPNHEAVLVDLGMAVVVGDSLPLAKGGTPGYLPPEFTLGYTPLPEADIYSVGKIAVFLVTGDQKMVERGELPADMDPRLQDFLGKMLRRDPMERPNGVDKLRDDLFRLRKEVTGRTESLEEIGRR